MPGSLSCTLSTASQNPPKKRPSTLFFALLASPHPIYLLPLLRFRRRPPNPLQHLPSQPLGRRLRLQHPRHPAPPPLLQPPHLRPRPLLRPLSRQRHQVHLPPRRRQLPLHRPQLPFELPVSDEPRVLAVRVQEREVCPPRGDVRVRGVRAGEGGGEGGGGDGGGGGFVAGEVEGGEGGGGKGVVRRGERRGVRKRGV